MKTNAVDTTITQSTGLAQDAQSTANSALASATQAIGSADGKNTNYFGNDHTTQSGKNGDLYYQTNSDKTVSMYQYNNGWQLIANDAAGVNFGAPNLVYNSNYSNNGYGWNMLGVGYLSNYPPSMYNGSQGLGVNISGKGTDTWTKFGESKHVAVPTTAVDNSANVFSFSAMVKIYEHSPKASVSVTLAFFDSNGNRIAPWKDATVHTDISDGQSTTWLKASFDGFPYTAGTVTMAIQYNVHGDTMHAMVANPIITQTSTNVPYHSGQTTIMADNIIGGTFDGARANLININASSISTGKLSSNDVSINGSTGKVDQTTGDVPYMPWKWDSSTFVINNGFISTSAKNAVLPGQGIQVNALGTYAPTYLKFTVFNPQNANDEWGRSYLDGGGLYVGLSSSQTIVNPGSVETGTVTAHSEIGVGNITINNGHSFYSNDNGDLYFRGYDDNHQIDIHAHALKSTSLLSQKTNISLLSPEEAMEALMNTDIYKYQYFSDLQRGSNEKYASLVIDDVNATPQYRADKAFITPEKDARDDGILANYSAQAIKYLYQKLNDQQKKMDVQQQELDELKQEIKQMKEDK